MVKSQQNKIIILVLALAGLYSSVNQADEAQVLAADFVRQNDRYWQVDVTLKHDDSGWDHYANIWRIEDQNGQVLANRILMHPHVDEQPFTRGLSKVEIPDSAQILYIRAHDNVHGWSTNTLRVDLRQAENGRIKKTMPSLSK